MIRSVAIAAIAVSGLLCTSAGIGHAFDWKRPEFEIRTMPTQPPDFSSQCQSSKIAGDQYRRPLRGLRRAVRQGRNPTILAIGSSSTVGVGASRPANAYIARLEVGLEAAFSTQDFEVVGKGMSGEAAEGQSARMRDTVAEVKPDLVIWQVGTNDALHHVDIETFKACLRRTLSWLAGNGFDVVLVDPQYGDELTKDGHYEQVVAAIAEIAREMHVLLVDRFEAMRELSRKHGDSSYLAADKLHLNDTGHNCMAEQLARALVAGVLQADIEANVGALVPIDAN
jgi:lysophospholipase L1-like esterase